MSLITDMARAVTMHPGAEVLILGADAWEQMKAEIRPMILHLTQDGPLEIDDLGKFMGLVIVKSRYAAPSRVELHGRGAGFGREQPSIMVIRS